MKKLLFSFFVLILSAGTILAQSSGTCGKNLTWEITADSVLTISGTGQMTNYGVGDFSPWSFYPRPIKRIHIAEGVTSIGNHAFASCWSTLDSVTIPNSVTYIGDGAFNNCDGLISIVIPNSVTSIGHGAFSDCNRLKFVTLTDSLRYIGAGVFSHCDSLKAPIYNSHTFIYFPASYCGEYIIPDGIETIASQAFYDCTGLSSVYIPNSVTNVGTRAFYNCSSLHVEDNLRYAGTYLVEAVNTTLATYTVREGTKWIGCEAFYKCKNITSVSIPNSVIFVDKNVFDYSNLNLTSPIYNTHVFVALPNSFSGSYEIPEGIESIVDNAFISCNNLTAITIPSSIKSIGENAFLRCYGLNVVNWNAINCRCSNPFHNSTSQVSSITFGEDVEYIPSLLCSEQTFLTSIEIPNSVTSIGDYAFSGCTGLTSVTLGNGVTSIGNYAFEGCSGLTSISIPNSVTNIGNSSFYYCNGLTSVTIGNNVTNIGNYTFFNCSSLSSITIPNSVTNIGKGAFLNCSELTTIMIEAETPSELGKDAFSYCSKLSSINVPCNTLEVYHTSTNWSDYMSLLQYSSLEFSITTYAENGNVVTPSTTCEDTILIATPNYGYHFVYWSDNITDNPRTIKLTQDTTFIAEFAPNKYSILVTCDSTQGSVEGDNGMFDYLTKLQYTAVPRYGYHFISWSDYSTTNPRTITVQQDDTLTAIFAPNIYTVLDESTKSRGHVDGAGSFEYLSEIEVSAIPIRGYQFVQWSDSVTNNPRSFVLTQDTIFEAQFDYLLNGKCGKDSVLVWTLDTTNLALNITGTGALTDLYTYGYIIRSISIGDDISIIGTDAFANCDSLKILKFGTSLKIIVQGAFPNAASIDTITCYSQRPPTINNGAFVNLAYSTVVYVPFEYLETYKMHDFWGVYDVRPLTTPESFNDISSEDLVPHKVMINGSVYILRDDKIYTTTGLEVR